MRRWQELWCKIRGHHNLEERAPVGDRVYDTLSAYGPEIAKTLTCRTCGWWRAETKRYLFTVERR